MVQSLVLGTVLLVVVAVGAVRAFRRRRKRRRGRREYGGKRRYEEGHRTEAQRERDRAHRRAQRRPPESVAEKGETYDLVVLETSYDRTPPEVRGTIDGLQTFVRDVPDPDGADALAVGDLVRVQVTDYGHGRTSAQARFLETPRVDEPRRIERERDRHPDERL